MAMAPCPPSSSRRCALVIFLSWHGSIIHRRGVITDTSGNMDRLIFASTPKTSAENERTMESGHTCLEGLRQSVLRCECNRLQAHQASASHLMTSHHLLDVSHQDPLQLLVVTIVLALSNLLLVLLWQESSATHVQGNRSQRKTKLQATPSTTFTLLAMFKPV